jgi:ATP-dependent DNA ligase
LGGFFPSDKRYFIRGGRGCQAAAGFRPLPLGKRKTRLARLPARVAPGIELNEHAEADGAAVFRQACKMSLEDIVSKRLRRPAGPGYLGTG